MNITEAEARKKWCPFARVSDAATHVNDSDPDRRMNVYPPAFNRVILSPNDDADTAICESSTNCVASECMAWREGVREGTGRCGLAGPA